MPSIIAWWDWCGRRNLPEQRTQSGQMEGEPLDNNLYLPLSTCRARFGETIIRRSTGSMEIETVELHQITVQMRDHAVG